MRRSSILAAILTAASFFASCEDNITIDPGFSVSISSSILEYERPVVSVSRTERTDKFYPCQVLIDGVPVTILNPAGTTILNMPSQEIHLPRLEPGTHSVEVVIGRTRKLYRDAESACGEKEHTYQLTVNVQESNTVVIAFTGNMTDIDRYIIIPQDNKVVNGNTGEQSRLDNFSIMPDKYTVEVYPFSARGEGITISEISENLDVVSVETGIGKGLDVNLKDYSKSTKASFKITAAGETVKIPVAS